jgi:AraC-like DNA-binding protein
VIDIDAACRSLDIGCQLNVGANRTEKTGRDRLRQRPTGTSLAWVLPHLVAHVAARGRDATPIRRLPGLRAKNFDDPDTRVADSTAVDAWRLAGQITDDDALGLHMAQAIPAGTFDVLEYAFRSSPTLGSALEQLARYGRVINDRAGARLLFQDDAIAVTTGPPTERQRVEFAFAFLIRLARETTGTSLTPLEVRFVHAPPESLVEHRAFFRAPLHYDALSNQLVLARSDTTRPLVSADHALAGVVRRRLDKMLTQIPLEDEPIAARVRRMLLDSLARGEGSADAIARELGVSKRTLHRRLRAEGASLRGILDEVRGEVATTLLRGTSLGTGEVAFVLGYSEPAAFHRFFRRWTGQTPRDFRRAGAATETN